MKEMLKPVIVLAAICLIVTAMLAFVNELTQPVIIKAEEQAAAAARSEVLPDAEKFEKIELPDMPDGVNEIYKGNDDTGYVVQVHTKGYGGDIKIICGVGTKAVDNNSGYRDKFVGKNKDGCKSVDTITGATISSTAYKKAVGIALDACHKAMEVKA